MKTKHYYIMGNYHGSIDELDSSDNLEEALVLESEYKMAFDSDWNIWISVRYSKATGLNK